MYFTPEYSAGQDGIRPARRPAAYGTDPALARFTDRGFKP